MRKTLCSAVHWPLTAHAQTVPPQFTGLLTNTTDYTTDPSWFTPTLPNVEELPGR